MTFPLCCGRLGQHEPHPWTARRGSPTARTYACNGHVVTAYAEQTWADEADAADLRAAMADERWAG